MALVDQALLRVQVPNNGQNFCTKIALAWHIYTRMAGVLFNMTRSDVLIAQGSYTKSGLSQQNSSIACCIAKMDSVFLLIFQRKILAKAPL